MKVPCYKCPDRTADCHSVCERYKQYKTDIEADKQRAKEEREKQFQFKSYRDEFMRKIQR